MNNQIFSLDRIIIRTTNQTFGVNKWIVEVVVRIPVKYWTECKKKGWLGQLYGVDISNFVHHFHSAIPAWNPVVKSDLRAKNGIKTIFLQYYVSDPKQAEALGMKVTYLRNGEFLSKFGEVNILV